MIESNYIYRNASWLDTPLVPGSGKTLNYSLRLFAERALVEMRLERERARLRELLLRMPDVTYFVDPEIEIFYWNHGALPTLVPLTSVVALSPKPTETWREWWRHDRMRVARLEKRLAF